MADALKLVEEGDLLRQRASATHVAHVFAAGSKGVYDEAATGEKLVEATQAYSAWLHNNAPALFAAIRDLSSKLADAERERDALKTLPIVRHRSCYSQCQRAIATIEKAIKPETVAELTAALAAERERRERAEGILRTVVESANVLKHVIPARTIKPSVAQSNETTILQLIAAHFDAALTNASAKEP